MLCKLSWQLIKKLLAQALVYNRNYILSTKINSGLTIVTNVKYERFIDYNDWSIPYKGR
jgi:hypothetical protein